MSPNPLSVDVTHEAAQTHYRFVAELPLLWTERLASGFAAQGYDIDSLLAERRDGRWHVHVTVRGRSSVDVGQLMDTEHQNVSVGPHTLHSFDVTRTAGGPLELRVLAPDRPGFLAFLLRELRTLALFPCEVEACARGSLADDRLVLVSVGGAAPSADTARALSAALGGHASDVPRALAPMGR